MIEKVNVSRETYEKLIEYQKLLLKWNKKINLMSEASTLEIWDRHIIDCLQLINLIKEINCRIIDVGAGAGLPGLVLSIAGISEVTLIEADSKKAAFLLQASRLSPNKVNIINERVENCENMEGDIMVCRGFASLIRMFEYTYKIKILKKYLLLKGEKIMEEIAVAKEAWLFNYILHDSITSKNGKIIEITNLRKLNVS